MDLNWKNIIIGMMLGIALLALIYFATMYFIQSEAQKVISTVAFEIMPGVGVDALNFDEIRISSSGEIDLDRFVGKIKLRNKRFSMLIGEYYFKADKISISEKGPRTSIYEVIMEGLEIRPVFLDKETEWLKGGVDIFHDCDARVLVKVEDISDRSMFFSGNLVRKKLKAITNGEKTLVSFDLEGISEFTLNDASIPVPFAVSMEGDKYDLTVDPGALEQLSAGLISSIFENFGEDIEAKVIAINEVNLDIFGQKELGYKGIDIDMVFKGENPVLVCGEYVLSLGAVTLNLIDTDRSYLVCDISDIRLKCKNGKHKDTRIVGISECPLEGGRIKLSLPLSSDDPDEILYQLRQLKNDLRDFKEKGYIPCSVDTSGTLNLLVGGENAALSFSGKSDRGRITFDLEGRSFVEFTKSIINYIAESAVQGVEIDHLGIGEFERKTSNIYSWKSFEIRIKPSREEKLFMFNGCKLSTGPIKITLLDLDNNKIALEVEDINAEFESRWELPERPPGADNYLLYNGKLELITDLDLNNIDTLFGRIQSMIQEFIDFVRTGKTRLAIDLFATTEFEVNGRRLNSRVWTINNDEGAYLVMDSKVVRAIAYDMGLEDRLSEAEIDLISMNPLRAPRLMWIWDYALEEASKAHSSYPVIEKDIYEHIIWSYLITKAYGEDFADFFGNLHELGNKSNSPEEHEKDLNNNKIGRKYALAGYSFSEILRRIRKDPAIAR